MKREVLEQLHARATSDGDGVKLLRVFGGAKPERFDPFLMMDEFGSNDPSGYIGGFPPHPHRGFQTITYMLQGKMEHKDHMGNVGLLNDSDIQWMTAGKGIIHSEMPRQTEGAMRGFQIWLNLPAKDKMQPAHYEDVAGEKVPWQAGDHYRVKMIAGELVIDGQMHTGYFDVADTHAIFTDLHIDPNQQVMIDLAEGHNLLVYVYQGSVQFGEKAIKASSQTLTRLTDQGTLSIQNASQEARLILLAGKPIKEPIAQYGPFVMNTSEQIEQALRDYQAGTLTE